MRSNGIYLLYALRKHNNPYLRSRAPYPFTHPWTANVFLGRMIDPVRLWERCKCTGSSNVQKSVSVQCVEPSANRNTLTLCVKVKVTRRICVSTYLTNQCMWCKETARGWTSDSFRYFSLLFCFLYTVFILISAARSVLSGN